MPSSERELEALQRGVVTVSARADQSWPVQLRRAKNSGSAQ